MNSDKVRDRVGVAGDSILVTSQPVSETTAFVGHCQNHDRVGIGRAIVDKVRELSQPDPTIVGSELGSGRGSFSDADDDSVHLVGERRRNRLTRSRGIPAAGQVIQVDGGMLT